jgi:hypothetical protein
MLLVAKLTMSLLRHLCVMRGDSGFGNGTPIGTVQCYNQASYQKPIRDVLCPNYIHALYIPRIQNLVNVTIGSEISYNIQHKNITIAQKNIQLLNQTHYI